MQGIEASGLQGFQGGRGGGLIKHGALQGGSPLGTCSQAERTAATFEA